MNADFFVHFGLYVRKHFLDPQICRRIAAEVRVASSHPASVRDAGVQGIDTNYRRSYVADVSERTVLLVRDRVRDLQADLERHFDVATTGCRRPEFLIYRQGDFFARHADSVAAGEQSDAIVTGRRLTVVVFLNSQTENVCDGGYCGGSLEFYGLVDEPRMQNRAMALTGEEGLLVAFRAETMHGVSPVIAGERLAVVTWFEGHFKFVS